MDPALFKDKVYLVTGGAAGIGFACVKHLLSYGAYVYTVDLRPEKSKELTAIQTDRLTYLPCDVSDRKSCHEVVDSLISKYGRFDGLVNNAGITLLEGELPSDEFYNSITEVNLRGVWNMTTEAFVHMKKQGCGSVVNIGSISAIYGKARLAVYAASKHAVLGLTRSWALDYAKYGIRINMVGPGELFSIF
jgi:NAD(P)-dependent dehydrogenase (short-subunit alcohol dehydrogenase family)